MRAEYEQTKHGTVDVARFIEVFDAERADFDGTDEEFVKESAQIMGRDFFDAEWMPDLRVNEDITLTAAKGARV